MALFGFSRTRLVMSFSLGQARQLLFAGVCATALAGTVPSISTAASSVQFNLLTWNDVQGTDDLPSAVGHKPSSGAAGQDWLVFTAGDQVPAAGYNSAGALSHNFADFTGATTGSGFNMAPSLSGTIDLQFHSNGPDQWTVNVTDLSYSGVATPTMFMNQRLVKSGDPATQNSSFNVDGIGNNGTWQSSAAGGYAIQYNLDFYFATNADGDGSISDVDMTYNDKAQAGYLLPVSLLTPQGLSGLTLDSATGFYVGDFKAYLTDQVAPRLPSNATYLLVTQMDKTHPDYAELGLPITVDGSVGNITFAYTTSAVPEPTGLAVLAMGSAALLVRRRRAACVEH